MIDMLMGHRGRGMGPAYWRPREDEVLDAYRGAVPYLTISESEELRDALTRERVEYRVKLREVYADRSVLEERIRRLEDAVQRVTEREG